MALSGFKVGRVLSEDLMLKRVNVLGTFEGKEGEAIVTLQRRHFDMERLPHLLSDKTSTELHFENDIYTKYHATLPVEDSLVSVDVIHPATAKHIAKMETQTQVMITESPAAYNGATLPYINNLPSGSIQWVYNVLEKKAEAERMLFEDADAQTGFMLHPDMKWDQTQLDGLYCLAICHRRDVRSLRDLNAAHLPLLRNIRAKSLAAIKERYNVGEDQLRIYVHYQPSYYHFHVHFVHTSIAGSGTAAGHAHLLDDIIDNIANITADYYAKRTLHYCVGVNHPLVEKLREYTRTAAAAE